MHALAGELGVSATVIQQALIEITGTQVEDYSLPPDLAAQVRARLRAGRATTGSPMFSGPAAATTASRPVNPVVGPVFANQNGAPRAAQGPRAQEGPAYSAALSEQLAVQSATKDENQPWFAAGLGPHDAHIIELCKRHGLTPEDLRLRVDGRTVASRLKNGESMSSVRSRMN